MVPQTASAKVAIVSLADVVQSAEFIGVVQVESVGGGIPLVRRPRASARIIESWKGPQQGKVRFAAAASWACDISDAVVGETAVVFIMKGNLAHAGRGRMPVFVREGRRLAAVWPDIRLPAEVATEAGPEAEYKFIRAVSVDDLRKAVAAARTVDARAQ